ncbi:hypothetical protein [Malonomonas rubra]|uniref:hypothetical protein n=1 Tax=Malonomonas rubra TaxID=57040 RepID=UPI0026EEDE05|nr:hypothetical protein [Malonomonas rubra]
MLQHVAGLLNSVQQTEERGIVFAKQQNLFQSNFEEIAVQINVADDQTIDSVLKRTGAALYRT